MKESYRIQREEYFKSFEFGLKLIKFLHGNGQFGKDPLPSDEEMKKTWDEIQLQKQRGELRP